MNPIVKKIVLKRFRSFPAIAVDLSNTTFVVGRNGAGKSNFIDAFAFLSDAVSPSLQSAFDARGGIQTVRHRGKGAGYPANLGIRVEFGECPEHKIRSAEYAFEVGAVPDHGFKVLRERCVITPQHNKPVLWFNRDELKKKEEARFASSYAELGKIRLEKEALALPVIGGLLGLSSILTIIRNIRVYSLEPRRLHRLLEPDGSVVLKKDGSNAASVVRDLIREKDSSAFESVKDLLSAIVPGITGVAPRLHGNRIGLEFEQQWQSETRQKFDASCMSDGTLTALGILLAIYQRESGTVLVLEEPETTMHPGALHALGDALRYAAKHMQVLITTHSPNLLTAIKAKPRDLRFIRWNNGESHIDPVADNQRREIRRQLLSAAELLETGALESENKLPMAFDKTELFPKMELVPGRVAGNGKKQ